MSQLLHGIIAPPRRIPIITRPDGPIQLLSNASFRKYEIATSNATIPMRLNQRPAMTVSRSAESESLGSDVCSGGGPKTAQKGRGAGAGPPGFGRGGHGSGRGGAAHCHF